MEVPSFVMDSDGTYIVSQYDIKNFDEVCENAEHVGTEKYDVIRMEKYQTDDFDRDLYSYIEYLLELGFKESDEDQRGTGEYEKVIRFKDRGKSRSDGSVWGRRGAPQIV